MANRTRDCDEAFTAGRLRKAEQFLGSAEMYAQGDDHRQAVTELSKVVPDGKVLGSDLRALLGMKNRAGYAAPPVTADDRKRAWRRAESLVEAARSR